MPLLQATGLRTRPQGQLAVLRGAERRMEQP